MLRLPRLPTAIDDARYYVAALPGVDRVFAKSGAEPGSIDLFFSHIETDHPLPHHVEDVRQELALRIYAHIPVRIEPRSRDEVTAMIAASKAKS
jgi:hypothetical protein